MADSGTRLGALIDDLENGSITAADACRLVRGMTWPRKAGKTAFQARLADALGDDGEPPPEASFADVQHAYHAGRISFRDYEQLHRAHAETIARG